MFKFSLLASLLGKKDETDLLTKFNDPLCRISNTSATKQRSMKKSTTTSPAVRRKSPRSKSLDPE